MKQAGYFDVSPLDLGENARRDIVLTLEEMEFVVESSHHEASPAQHEIDFEAAEALTTADNIQTFKLTVKTIARRGTACMPRSCQSPARESTAPACISTWRF